jgi:thiamine-phosphate pyrophosphorylase
LEPIRHAAATARLPWFAIGGLDSANLAHVIDAGARRIVVVRALTEARDPAGTARALKEALDGVA